MKLTELGCIHSAVPPVEKELAVRIDAIFGRCPALYGFAVRSGASLAKEFPEAALEGALVLSDVGFYPSPGEAERDRVCNVIAALLHDFMRARPEGAQVLLRGRTFARVLH